MKSKDPNYAVKVEQAIVKKYGEEAVQHPRNNPKPKVPLDR